MPKKTPKPTLSITFIHNDQREETIEALEEMSIMQAAKYAKTTEIDGTCGGCMACATCHIQIPEEWKNRVENEDNEKTPEECDILETAPNATKNSRLGCQIRLTKALDGLRVIIPPNDI